MSKYRSQSRTSLLILPCRESLFSFSNINDCYSDLCENGANCTDEVNNYTCTCLAGYEDPNCSIGKLDHFPSHFTS